MNKRIFIYISLLFLFGGLYVATEAFSKPDKAADPFAAYSISSVMENGVVTVKITGKDAERLSVVVDGSRLLIKDRNAASGAPSSKNYELPAAVDEGGMSISRDPGVLVMKLPVAGSGEPERAVKITPPAPQPRRTPDADPFADPFDFDVPSMGKEDEFIKKFMGDDMFDMMDRQFEQMRRMRSELNRKFAAPGRPHGGVKLFSEYNVSHRVDGDTLVVTISGKDLGDLSVKVENGMMSISNNVSRKDVFGGDGGTSEVNSFSTSSRSFSLPVAVDANRMRVEKSRDVVTVTLPLAEKPSPGTQGGAARDLIKRSVERRDAEKAGPAGETPGEKKAGGKNDVREKKADTPGDGVI